MRLGLSFIGDHCMDSFKHDAISEVVEREGGFVDDPTDRGGATKYGITEAVAREFGYKGNMRDLPLETAIAIYDQRYWQKLKLDQIEPYSQPLAVVLFDYAVNSGVSRASTELQRTLNVLNEGGTDYPDISEDGIVGPGTLRALEGLKKRRSQQGINVLAATINCCRVEFLQSLSIRKPSQERFTFGWFLRALNLFTKFRS